jgi:hypothetical protein
MVLKVFAGADTSGMAEERAAWHRAKLEELGEMLEGVRLVSGYEPSELTLLAGLSYHRHMLGMLDEMKEGN